MYELNGTERKETTREKVDCGESVQTFYYDAATGVLLRKDTNIEVSKEFMNKFLTAIRTRKP